MRERDDELLRRDVLNRAGGVLGGHVSPLAERASRKGGVSVGSRPLRQKDLSSRRRPRSTVYEQLVQGVRGRIFRAFVKNENYELRTVDYPPVIRVERMTDSKAQLKSGRVGVACRLFEHAN